MGRIGRVSMEKSMERLLRKSQAGDKRPPESTKKPARVIDEDDYGDDEEEEEGDDLEHTSPLKNKLDGSQHYASAIPDRLKVPLPAKLMQRSVSNMSDGPKSSEDVRKKLEQDKKAAEDAARQSFNTLFYTLETDRDAMLEQQKLDELDRQVETEMSGANAGDGGAGNGQNDQPSTLSNSALGGSISLTLKHLIARIDQKREMVHASDAQLRTLMSEVRRNRSKWASEDKVGQEELYESMEKVLMELKAMTEHAHPFLQKVNKREAPDYYQIIKTPYGHRNHVEEAQAASVQVEKGFCGRYHVNMGELSENTTPILRIIFEKRRFT